MVNWLVATNKFNFLDKIIAKLRLSVIIDKIDPDDEVLDLGCGSQGYFLKAVSEKIKRGIGLDAEVENKKQGNLEFKKFRFKRCLPFKERVFDKVVMLAVLEHMKPLKVKILFSEFSRVLKSNGNIILTTPTPASKKILELMAKLGIISREEIADHQKYYGQADLERMARDSSLKLESYRLFEWGLNSVAIYKKS